MIKVKTSLKNVVHKIKGTESKPQKKPEEILKDLEPHFIRTLTQNNETDKLFFIELHKRLIDLADKGRLIFRRYGEYVFFQKMS